MGILLEDGALLQILLLFHNEDYIVLNILNILKSLCVDPKCIQKVLTHFPSPLNSSLLKSLSHIASEKLILAQIGYSDRLSMLIVQFLDVLADTGIVPVSVLFNRKLVQQISQGFVELTEVHVEALSDSNQSGPYIYVFLSVLAKTLLSTYHN